MKPMHRKFLVLFGLVWCSLVLFGPKTITRGPYLQQGTPSSIVVRWRTDVATTSRVRYGTTPGNFTTVVSDPASTTEHIVSVTGLQSLTRYYYEVGTGTAFFVGDANDF